MNQKHRIFIAINLPEDIKKRLLGYSEKWPELPARWTKNDNLHITLLFLGYIADNQLMDICSKVKEASQNHSSFSINLNKICYGPKDKFPPKMVWLTGQISQELVSLQNDLAKHLGMIENRFFSPHITLARIRAFEWKGIEPEERPDIEEEMNLTFEAESVEIMESLLKRNGPEYITLESYSLK